MKTKLLLKTGCFLSLALIFSPIASSARGDVIWNESLDGPLSSNGNAPSSFILSPGTSSVIGEVGTYGGDNANYQDFLALTIPAGYELSSEVCSNFNSPLGDDQGFTGFVAGGAFDDSQLYNRAYYLGFTHFGPGTYDDPSDGEPPVVTLNTNLLPIEGDTYYANGAQGFTGSLPSGTYTFDIQQDDADTFYEMDFTVTTVPEPTSMALVGVAGMLALRRRSRGSA